MIADSEHLHNFHTHTFRCKHAQGDVDDYCQVASELGMKTLGFSDHSAMPDDRWVQVRMEYAELDDYTAAIDKARVDYPELKILKGMECEYVPKFKAWYEDELIGERQFEYLVGAAHFFLEGKQWHGSHKNADTPERLRAFAQYNVEMMETGLFDFIAHPDLFGNCYAEWDENTEACTKDILAAAAEYNVGLEINALGLRKQAYKKENNPFPLYPWKPFWELASEYEVKVIVNSDAHRPVDLQSRTGAAKEIAAEFDLVLMDVAEIGTRHA
ncbi:MAG: histidinol-phosphatase [Pseudomonadota bacterium]